MMASATPVAIAHRTRLLIAPVPSPWKVSDIIRDECRPGNGAVGSRIALPRFTRPRYIRNFQLPQPEGAIREGRSRSVGSAHRRGHPGRAGRVRVPPADGVAALPRGRGRPVVPQRATLAQCAGPGRVRVWNSDRRLVEVP